MPDKEYGGGSYNSGYGSAASKSGDRRSGTGGGGGGVGSSSKSTTGRSSSSSDSRSGPGKSSSPSGGREDRGSSYNSGYGSKAPGRSPGSGTSTSWGGQPKSSVPSRPSSFGSGTSTKWGGFDEGRVPGGYGTPGYDSIKRAAIPTRTNPLKDQARIMPRGAMPGVYSSMAFPSAIPPASTPVPNQWAGPGVYDAGTPYPSGITPPAFGQPTSIASAPKPLHRLRGGIGVGFGYDDLSRLPQTKPKTINDRIKQITDRLPSEITNPSTAMPGGFGAAPYGFAAPSNYGVMSSLTAPPTAVAGSGTAGPWGGPSTPGPVASNADRRAPPAYETRPSEVRNPSSISPAGGPPQSNPLVSDPMDHLYNPADYDTLYDGDPTRSGMFHKIGSKLNGPFAKLDFKLGQMFPGMSGQMPIRPYGTGGSGGASNGLLSELFNQSEQPPTGTGNGTTPPPVTPPPVIPPWLPPELLTRPYTRAF